MNRLNELKHSAGRFRARFLAWRRRKPQGHRGIRKLGHREYVGGLWDEMGRLQFDFLVAQGLKPSDVLLDIGCGSLRGGVQFIRYLDPGNYLGMEKKTELIRLGVSEELGTELYQARGPELIASGRFEFNRFSKVPTYALAQSLFSHLIAADIDRCMDRLWSFVHPGCRFFATFLETDSPVKPNPRRSHDHSQFHYSRDEILDFGERSGWHARYIGEWGHPRGQIMVEYVASHGI
jgi:hypothetical protein